MEKKKLNKNYILIIVIFIALFFTSCSIKNRPDIVVLIKAKCIYNSGNEARFESNVYDYSEIIVQNDVSKYEVGKFYYIEIKKK